MVAPFDSAQARSEGGQSGNAPFNQNLASPPEKIGLF